MPNERGRFILADKFLQGVSALRLHSHGYAELKPLLRRQRANRAITALASIFACIDGDQTIVLQDISRSFHLLDSEFDAPLLAKSNSEAEKAEEALTEKRKRQFNRVAAWVLATYELLVAEGCSNKTATARIANKLRVGVEERESWRKNFGNWRNKLKNDNAPFVGTPHGAHLQRLSFRVLVCLSYAYEYKLDADRMFKLLDDDPALVIRLAGCRAGAMVVQLPPGMEPTSGLASSQRTELVYPQIEGWKA